MAANYVEDPVLDDIMEWHVYIGYCREDKERVKALLALMPFNKLKCFLRSSVDVKECSHSDNIKRGITFSHKCMLYISQDYLKDEDSCRKQELNDDLKEEKALCRKQELKEAKRKLKFLGKNSVFVLIESDVKQEQLGKYKQFEPIYLQDNQTVQDILMKHPNLSDFELKPELSGVPKQNIGVGVAYTYFFGFLQVVIPGIRAKFEAEMEPHSFDKKRSLVTKMLIIIPKTVKSPLTLEESGALEPKFTIKQCAHRAGKPNREYTLQIYELTDDESNDIYYAIVDLPACLYAIREAFDRQLTNMPMDEVYEARHEFVLTLKALLKHPDYESSFANQWELLMFHDDKDDFKLSKYLCQQIKSRGLTESPADVPIPAGVPIQETVGGGTFQIIPGISSYPMYREMPHYALKNASRGFCVIINNFSFPESLKDCLAPRPHAETEIKNLTRLFEKLSFKVEVHRNLNEQKMMECLKQYQEKDHSGSDAFVCCLLSHGDKGRIVAADGKEVPIMKLMEFFFESNCPGLKKKPKLFFIGACQGGVTGAADAVSSVTPEAHPDPDDPSLREATPQSSAEIVIDLVPPAVDAQPSSPSESGKPLTPEANPGNLKSPPLPAAEIVRDLVPPTVDFIVSYATLPYGVAWADEESGGLYIDALCKHLVRDLEIDVALRYVNQEMKKLLDKYTEGGKKNPTQDPFHIIMPPHKFLFLGSSQNMQP